MDQHYLCVALEAESTTHKHDVNCTLVNMLCLPVGPFYCLYYCMLVCWHVRHTLVLFFLSIRLFVLEPGVCLFANLLMYPAFVRFLSNTIDVHLSREECASATGVAGRLPDFHGRLPTDASSETASPPSTYEYM